MRMITTIATDECRAGLILLVATLRHVGWSDNVHVFVPSGYSLKPLAGCILHQLPAWWRYAVPQDQVRKTRGERMKEISVHRTCNAPALLKPDVFLAFSDNAQVLYLDSADILVFTHPDRLFDLLHAQPQAILAAHPYESVDRSMEDPRCSHLAFLANMLRDCRPSPRYNDGVILARMTPACRLFMRYWKMVLGHAAYLGTFGNLGAKRTVVGDQIAFNACIAEPRLHGMVLDLPAEWNYRGYQHVQACKLHDGVLYSPGGSVVHIAHASGSGGFGKALNDWTRELLRAK